jgi:hypothetical protein
MYARAIDHAATNLLELRREEWCDFALGATALSLAVAATSLLPALAMPLFLGGVAVVSLGVRAAWRRWDLLDRLAGERDAYVIPQVEARARREVTVERRHDFAATIRKMLQQEGPAYAVRARSAADELEALAAELDNLELALHPACAVACMRLLSESAESPLLNPALPAASLGLRISQIRSGFSPTRTAV